jgi:hypothetical protein
MKKTTFTPEAPRRREKAFCFHFSALPAPPGGRIHPVALFQNVAQQCGDHAGSVICKFPTRRTKVKPQPGKIPTGRNQGEALSRGSANLFFRSAARLLWARKTRGPTEQVHATLPQPEFLPIMGSRRALNAQNDTDCDSFRHLFIPPSRSSVKVTGGGRPENGGPGG